MSRISMLCLAVVFSLAPFLAGCGGSGGSVDTASTTLSGIASKGPVASATVTAYSVLNGAKSAVLGSVLTDSIGGYSLDIGAYTGPVLIEVTGGTYKDEATGIKTALASTLRSAVPNASGAVPASVTALTEAAVQNAMAAAGGLTAVNMKAENDNVKTQVGFDPVSTKPADATESASATASAASKAYAAYLGSVSQYIQNNPGATPASAAGDFAASFKTGGLTANAAIKKAVDDFGANKNNMTGVASMTSLETISTSIGGMPPAATAPTATAPAAAPSGSTTATAPSGSTSATTPSGSTSTTTGSTTATTPSGSTATTVAANAKPTIVFDYTYDTNGFFTPARRALMEAAAAVFTSRIGGTKWARVDPVTLGGHYDLAFYNPSTMELTWRTDVVMPENQITIYLGATDFTKSPVPMMQTSGGDGATQLLSIRKVTGGVATVLTSATQLRPIDATITFDLQGIKGFSAGITRQWHFDSDGNLATDDRSATDPHYGDYTDFYDTAIHELGHVLGIYNPGVYSAYLEADPNFALAYTSRVQADGSGFVFTGTYAKQAYYNHVGQNIPLDAPTKSHFANGVRSLTADGFLSVSYEATNQFRKTFSELEFQVLRDLGYTISAKP